MKIYTIKFTMENWYEVKVTAEDEEQAREIFFTGNFDDEPRLFGEEIQEGIDVEEEASA